MRFSDRKDAGKKLAEKLLRFKTQEGVVVLGLPRGGVVVAGEVVRSLEVSLDIVVPRKIGAPDNPEFAIGAITETGEGIFDKGAIEYLNVSEKYIKETVEEEKKEALRRLEIYRGGREPVDLNGKTVILIDDGIATGSTMRAAIKSVRKKGCGRVVVAVPVIAADTVNLFEEEADELVYLDSPAYFGAVGNFYEEFEQTEDKEVIEIMKRCQRRDYR